jgi:hypothetical protein
MEEVWKDINGYEGLYQISNLGRVKSLSREWTTYRGGKRSKDETIMAISPDGKGYMQAFLSKDKKRMVFKVHHLVWNAFGNTQRNALKQIDHIDNIKTNNGIDNLRIVTNRENSSKRSMQRTDKTSEYTGVSLDKRNGKWSAQIRTLKLSETGIKYLGKFPTQLQASLAYQKALISIGEL